VDIDFMRGTALMKALADETRVRIVHILSCGELCACDILSHFELTQPTLSHHLSVLVESGLVTARPVGKWTYYRLSGEPFEFLETFIKTVSHDSDACPCKKPGGNCE